MVRDRDMASGSSSKSPAVLKEEACANFWRELVGPPFIFLGHHQILIGNSATWKGRTEIIEYCVKVVDQTMEERRKNLTVLGKESSSRLRDQMPSMSDRSDVGEKAREHRREQALLYSDQVKASVISMVALNLGVR